MTAIKECRKMTTTGGGYNGQGTDLRGKTAKQGLLVPALFFVSLLAGTPAVAATVDAYASFNLSRISYIDGALLPGAITGAYSTSSAFVQNNAGEMNSDSAFSQPSEATRAAVVRDMFNLPADWTDSYVLYGSGFGSSYTIDEYFNRPALWEPSAGVSTNVSVSNASSFAGGGYDAQFAFYGATGVEGSGGAGAMISGQTDGVISAFSGYSGADLYLRLTVPMGRTILSLPYATGMTVTGLDSATTASGFTYAAINYAFVEGDVDVGFIGPNESFLTFDSFTPFEASQTQNGTIWLDIFSNEADAGLGLYLTVSVQADTATSAVPVPPAFLLFGTGLLAISGIRRKLKGEDQER